MKKIAKLLKFFLPTLFFLVLLEIIVRLLNLPPYPRSNGKDMYVANNDYNFGLSPGYRNRMSTDEFNNDVFINLQGYRDTQNGDLDLDAVSAGKRKILFLGDSLTFGVGVNYKNSFVGKFLESNDYYPINAGVPSFGPLNSLAQLKKIGHSTKPAIVIYTLYIGNDFYDSARGFVKFVVDGYLTEYFPPNISEGDLRSWLYTRGVLQSSESNSSEQLPPVKYFDSGEVPDDNVIDTSIYSELKYMGFMDKLLVNNSELYRFLRYKGLYIPFIREIYFKHGISSLEKCSLPYLTNVFASDYPTSNNDIFEWSTTISSIIQMRDYVERELKAKFILGVIPIKEQVNESLWSQELSLGCLPPRDLDIMRPNKLLNEFSRIYQINFIDMLGPLRDEYNAGRDPYYKIDSHLKENGYDVVYEQYLSAVKNQENQ